MSTPTKVYIIITPTPIPITTNNNEKKAISSEPEIPHPAADPPTRPPAHAPDKRLQPPIDRWSS